jgi:pSer/pThr/pTyr-binding forkhead associated (FHA) protein
MRVAPVVPAGIAAAAAAIGASAEGQAAGSRPGLAISPVGGLPAEDRAMSLRPGPGRSVPASPTTDSASPATPPIGAYVRVDPDGPSSAAKTPASPGAQRVIAVVEVRTQGRTVATRPFSGGTLSVGRGRDNGLVLADERVSRNHGQLTARRGVLVYTDLGSTNGSFLNGTRVREIVLGSGDVVRLGNSTLTIKSQS